ncbi:hypothetical protein [Pseudosporangium ferrugineum]|nr:hypothetical protein [Pseudosporangium ferrugineum]
MNTLPIAAPTTPPPGMSITVTILVAVISSGVVAAFVNAVSSGMRANANARRDRYAQAVRYLVAWGEYPYRIRRRTDDEPKTLSTLAARGHALQEQRAEVAGWIAGESRALSKIFNECARDVSAIVTPACAEAWNSAPLTKGSDMNLGGFGPRGVDIIVARMERACRYRFGIRRLMWSGLVMRRLREWQHMTPSQPQSTIGQKAAIEVEARTVPATGHKNSEPNHERNAA